MLPKWSKPFSEWFNAKIHPVIHEIGSWELQPYGLTSVTTNSSESFNHVLKQLQKWKEVTVDAMVLSLFRLAQFHIAEVSRGRRNAGKFALRAGIQPTFEDVEEELPTPPTEIVDAIRNPLPPPPQPPAALEPSSSSPASPAPASVPASPTSQEQPVISQSSSCDNTASLTSAERAVSVIRNGKITLDSKLAVFTVMGTLEPRVVRLYPSTTCSCPAKSGCYHVKAAQLAIGIREQASKKKLNLTQLRKNKRKRNDKTSGRKRPRIADVDVIPAGDVNDNELEQMIAAVASGVESSSSDQPTIPLPSNDLPMPPSCANPVPFDDAPPLLPPSAIPVPLDSHTTDDSRCAECGLQDPPANISKRSKISWIQCDACQYWHHRCCTAIPRGKTVTKFICSRCIGEQIS